MFCPLNIELNAPLGNRILHWGSRSWR